MPGGRGAETDRGVEGEVRGEWCHQIAGVRPAREKLLEPKESIKRDSACKTERYEREAVGFPVRLLLGVDAKKAIQNMLNGAQDRGEKGDFSQTDTS